MIGTTISHYRGNWPRRYGRGLANGNGNVENSDIAGLDVRGCENIHITIRGTLFKSSFDCITRLSRLCSRVAGLLRVKAKTLEGSW